MIVYSYFPHDTNDYDVLLCRPSIHLMFIDKLSLFLKKTFIEF